MNTSGKRLTKLVDEVLLTIQSDPAPQREAPPRYAHVQLDDVSFFLIQKERGRGRWDLGQQHDGVVAMVEVHAGRASQGRHAGGRRWSKTKGTFETVEPFDSKSKGIQ